MLYSYMPANPVALCPLIPPVTHSNLLPSTERYNKTKSDLCPSHAYSALQDLAESLWQLRDKKVKGESAMGPTQPEELLCWQYALLAFVYGQGWVDELKAMVTGDVREAWHTRERRGGAHACVTRPDARGGATQPWRTQWTEIIKKKLEGAHFLNVWRRLFEHAGVAPPAWPPVLKGA